jgi:hypothetical protein
MTVTALVIKQLENAAKDVSRQHVKLLADKYSFDAEEAIEWLDIVAPLTLEEKKMARKAKAEGDDSSTDSKKKTVPLPWMGVVNPDCCQAIAYNYGLFTQCQKKKVGTFYCAACTKAAAETVIGAPPCGTVADRLTATEYKDSKGRVPVEYGKVLYKLKLTLEDAVEAATAKGLVIPTHHMNVYEPPKGKKGEKMVDAEGNEFDAMVAGSVASSTSSKGRKLSPEEKLEREEKRKAEKAEKDAAAALKKKHETDAKALAAIGRNLIQLTDEGIPLEIAQAAIDKYNETNAKKAEAQAKRDAEKAIKKAEADIKKAEAKAQKDAEKEAKKAEKEAAKKGTVKPAVVAAPAAAVAAAPAAPAEPAPAAVKVTRINAAGEVGKKGMEGFIYLRDSNNVVYNADTKEIIGNWNGTQIVFEDAEEEEETI